MSQECQKPTFVSTTTCHRPAKGSKGIMLGTLDPRICNIHLDANALDRDGSAHDTFVDRVLALREADEINFIVSGSVRREASHPHTPANVQAAMLPEIYTLPVSRTVEEQATLGRIRAVLMGNAQTRKHDDDAEHLFEASKYGGGYFITHDRRMLNKRDELRPLIGPTLAIVTLEEFLAAYDRFATASPVPRRSR